MSSRICSEWDGKAKNINTNQVSPGEIELPNQYYEAVVKSSDNFTLD